MADGIFLDSGSIFDLTLSGGRGFSVLEGAAEHFYTTNYVIDELPEPTRTSFLNWASGQSNYTLLDYTGLFENNPQLRDQYGAVIDSAGKQKQFGEFGGHNT